MAVGDAPNICEYMEKFPYIAPIAGKKVQLLRYWMKFSGKMIRSVSIFKNVSENYGKVTICQTQDRGCVG